MSTYCTARERLYRNQYSIAPSWAQHVAGFWSVRCRRPQAGTL